MNELHDERLSVFARIGQELQELEGCIFAVAFGSAVESPDYRDVDVAVYLDREVHPPANDLRVAIEWGVRLTRRAGLSVDVSVVNDASIGFRYNVTKGWPLLETDLDSWPDFRERTWNEYLDMVPFFESFFKEVAS